MSALSSRAFNRVTAPEHLVRKKGVTPKGINSQSLIDNLQGLEIQPFIFALVQAIPDMDAQTGDPLLAPRTPQQQQNHHTIRQFKKVLWDVGYSSKGNPYWVHRHGPNLNDMRTMTDAAENCIDILNDRRLSLKQAATITPPSKHQHDTTGFEHRYQAFATAMDGITHLADRAQFAQMERDKIAKIQPGEMCALA